MEFSEIFTRPAVLWFIIGLLFLLAEFGVPGLIIIFFGVGAWITMLVCLFFDVGLNWQLLIFISSSIIILLLMRNYLRKIFYEQAQNDSNDLEDDFLGKTAEVLSEIQPGKTGVVRFKGTDWNATADQRIKKGQSVRIISKESITLKVEQIDIS